MIFELICVLMGLILIYILLELVEPTPQTGTIKGSVTYGDASVDGVLITLTKEGEVLLSTTTQADGTFEFDEVAIGTYTVRAHKDVPEGYLGAEMFVEVIGGDQLELTLPLVKEYS
jgi:hypothetical protein